MTGKDQKNDVVMVEKAKKLVVKYGAGDYICKEGDVGYDMYIIKSGKFEVLKEMGGTELKVATLGPMDFFGEMALFGDSKRSAAVRAVNDSEVIVVTKKMLMTQFAKVPDWLVKIINTIANRIRSTSKGVKIKYTMGLDFTVLKCIHLVGSLMGTPTVNGAVIPVDIIRDEIKYMVGIDYDVVDVWLKRFNLVNFVSIKGGTGMVEVPNMERVNKYCDFLFSKSREGQNAKIQLESDTMKSFERIYKLMSR